MTLGNNYVKPSVQINVSVSLFLMYRERFSGPGYSGLVAFIYTLDSQNGFW